MNQQSQQNDGHSASRRTLWLIALCFLLSGFAALLYETVWLRQFAIVLGTSEQALAVILASYMGGLAFGAWMASKWVGEIRRPVWTYGVLELGIAGCALLMPWGLDLAGYLQVVLFGGSPRPPAAGSFSQTLFGLAACFSLILLPTAMMGATLPLLAKHVIHRDHEIGPRVGLLYGINTFGAVGGTLAAAFVLLPHLGLRRTTLAGAAVNGMVFLIVLALTRGMTSGAGVGVEQDAALEPEPDRPDEPLDHRYRLVLWFAAIAGAIAFCYEIIFTRMLGHLLGGSIFAFATMLAGFLLGIALGGTLASRLAVRRDRSSLLFVYAQSLAAITALVAYRSLDVLAGWSFQDWGGTSATLTQVAVSILVLLPPATCIGATYPLATRMFARDESEAATASARVYMWNTIGGILGALFTGIVLLPAFAYQGSIFFAIAVNVIVAITLACLMKVRFVHIALACLTLAMLLVFPPPFPDRVMRLSALDSDGSAVEGDLIFSRVGRSATVVLFDEFGDTRFFTNGLPEAIVGQRGTQDPHLSSGAWLSSLPSLLRSGAESMSIIGLGGGVAAAYAPPSIKEVDVFELEPAVVEANAFIRNRRDLDPLADPRINIILNDGRNGLALTKKRYDVIVSQPSHPWTAGASHLYTREFASTVRSRLNDRGIFLQWMNVSFIDEDLFRSLTATLLEVFPHLRVYEPFPGNLLFTASDQPIRPEAVSGSELIMSPEDVFFYREFGIQSPSHLFALLRIDEPELRRLSEHAPPITDEFNRLAMRSPGLLTDVDSSDLSTFLDEYSPLSQSPEQIRENCPSIKPSVLATRLLQRDWKIDLTNLFSAGSDQSERLIYDAFVAKSDGQIDDSVQYLKTFAARDPEDPRPAFSLLAYRRLGTFPAQSLSDTEIQELSKRLDSRYRSLLDAVEAVAMNDLAAVRLLDPNMASFGIDEVGYELAVRLRVLWRIADTGPQRRIRNAEAIDLISEAIPMIGSDALIPFRVAAAIGAERPEIALASVLDYARSVVRRIKLEKVTSVSRLENLRSNLIKCRSMLEDVRGMPTVSDQQYRQATEYLDKAIAGNL